MGLQVVMENSTFRQNEALSGAAMCSTGHGSVTSIGNKFMHNKAREYGGALYVENTAVINIKYNSFTSNSAQRGGAISCFMDALTLKRNERRRLNAHGANPADQLKVSFCNCKNKSSYYQIKSFAQVHRMNKVIITSCVAACAPSN